MADNVKTRIIKAHWETVGARRPVLTVAPAPLSPDLSAAPWHMLQTLSDLRPEFGCE